MRCTPGPAPWPSGSGWGGDGRQRCGILGGGLVGTEGETGGRGARSLAVCSVIHRSPNASYPALTSPLSSPPHRSAAGSSVLAACRALCAAAMQIGSCCRGWQSAHWLPTSASHLRGPAEITIILIRFEQRRGGRRGGSGTGSDADVTSFYPLSLSRAPPPSHHRPPSPSPYGLPTSPACPARRTACGASRKPLGTRRS